MTKEFIYKVTVNKKFDFKVQANNVAEAEIEGEKFYLKNNFFADKTIKSISTQICLRKDDIVNL